MKIGMQGLVSLVGAGPGDPDLITVKGTRRLQQADAVVYDYLANDELLAYCPPSAARHYVGKQAGSHSMSQDDINNLLVELGRQGKRVVRLKGGDPFIFGRGGEEAEALEAAGVPWEVVPGISSGVAAPAYAGIPVTHRDWASSVVFVTGHEDPTRDTTRVDWQGLGRATGTIVLYMGVGNLGEIAARLVAGGRSPSTPVAAIRWGTLGRQETVVGTLATIVDDVAAAKLKPPAVVVIGDVVRLRDKLRWFDSRPLWGKRVVVTRAREQASALGDRLRELGAEPIEYPVIAFAPPADFQALDDAIAHLSRYDWVIFTSVNGVRFFSERLVSAGLGPDTLAGVRIGAIGPATAEAALAAGLQPSFVPDEFVAEAVVEQIGAVAGRRVLLPRADIAREALAAGLEAKGAMVDNVVAYRTVLGEAEADVARLLRDHQIDAVTFTSSSTVKNFFARLEQSGMPNDEARALLEGVTVAAIGPITARTARDYGLDVMIEAEKYTIDGLVDALVQALGQAPSPMVESI
jgi:uroporphyrinogen III methyltransferase/synthase